MIEAIERISTDISTRKTATAGSHESTALETGTTGSDTNANTFARVLEHARSRIGNPGVSEISPGETLQQRFDAGGKVLSDGFSKQLNSIQKLTEMSPFDPAYNTQVMAMAFDATKDGLVRDLSIKICAKSVDGFNQLLKTQ